MGQRFGDDDNIVWGNNIVWGDGLIGMSLDDDNIVWGNLDDDNIVWGNLDDDNIVWGNLDDDNIVWGNSLATTTTSCGATRSQLGSVNNGPAALVSAKRRMRAREGQFQREEGSRMATHIPTICAEHAVTTADVDDGDGHVRLAERCRCFRPTAHAARAPGRATRRRCWRC